MDDLHCPDLGVVVDRLPGGLDLAGHVLSGDGGTGVVLRAGAGEVNRFSVQNGTLTGWDVAVAFDGPDGHVPSMDVWTAEVHDVGVVVASSSPVEIRAVYATVRDNDVVLDLAPGSSGDFEGSTLERNRRVVAPSAGSRFGVTRSDVLDNDEVLPAGASLRSFSVVGSLVRGNGTVVGAGADEVYVQDSRFVDNGVAVDAGTASGTVRDSVLERNVVGVAAAAGGGPLTVQGNRFRHHDDAVVAEAGADVRLGGNVVQGSTGWGIHAPGATDLGGNTAAGNGQEPQCVGVVCGEADPAPERPEPGGRAAVTACGQFLTEDSYLAHDLECSGRGLELLYAVDVDLAGHTLTGDGTGAAVTALGLEEPGRTDDDDPRVRVHGGRITGWSVGVGPSDATQWCSSVMPALVLEDLEVEHTGTGVCRREFLNLDVRTSAFRDLDVLLTVGGQTQVRISDSHVERVRLGIYGADDASSYTFTRTTLIDVKRVAGGGGMSSLAIIDSHVEGADAVVGEGDSWTGLALRGSTFVGNGVVLSAGVTGGLVTDNVFEGNDLAITALPRSGTWWDNTLRVLGNTFRGNGDAVDVPDGADVALQGNTAHDNTGWGIHAPGATDLGGNRAWGNGNEPQCLGVVCAGAPS